MESSREDSRKKTDKNRIWKWAVLLLFAGAAVCIIAMIAGTLRRMEAEREYERLAEKTNNVRSDSEDNTEGTGTKEEKTTHACK